MWCKLKINITSSCIYSQSQTQASPLDHDDYLISLKKFQQAYRVSSIMHIKGEEPKKIMSEEGKKS